MFSSSSSAAAALTAHMICICIQCTSHTLAEDKAQRQLKRSNINAEKFNKMFNWLKLYLKSSNEQRVICTSSI
jgi:hypothetical protein